MFSEKKMSEAIAWLFDQFKPEDYQKYDAKELGVAGGLYLPEVCNALRDDAQIVYEFSLSGGYSEWFDYRGKELFNKRGILLISDIEEAVVDKESVFYETELWLMEDMTFALVRCTTIVTGSEKEGYTGEYRAFKKKVEGRDDLFFEPEELIEKLESMCVPHWEGEATIYEL